MSPVNTITGSGLVLCLSNKSVKFVESATIGVLIVIRL